MRSLLIAAILALFLSLVQVVGAAEFSLSGFGTVGYAISDKEYAYQRFIDDNGTIKRDTVFGMQADVKFNENFGLTVQGKFALSEKDDDKWSPDISWAFLSYRPTNDWLFRVGKMRGPLYMNSESLDVGVTYDMAHLPAEVYWSAPTNDYIAACVSKTFNSNIGEFLLEGYWSKAPLYFRTWMRDDAEMLGGMPQGQNYVKVEAESVGLVMTFQRNSDIFRAGFYYVTAEMADGSPIVGNYTLQPVYYPTPMGPIPIGSAYQPDILNASLSTDIFMYTLGSDIDLGHDFRLIAEYSRREVPDNRVFPDSHGGYLALLKRIGRWAPYITASGIYSAQKVRDLYNEVNAYQIQGPAASLNLTQRQIADSIVLYEQYTLAVGTSYSLTPKQKIKAEWSQTHIGLSSSFADSPPGPRISDADINVFSISYSFVF